MTKKYLSYLLITGIIAPLLLSGCAHHDLKAPCPNYGSSCRQVPINHWNNN